MKQSVEVQCGDPLFKLFFNVNRKKTSSVGWGKIITEELEIDKLSFNSEFSLRYGFMCSKIFFCII